MDERGGEGWSVVVHVDGRLVPTVLLRIWSKDGRDGYGVFFSCCDDDVGRES